MLVLNMNVVPFRVNSTHYEKLMMLGFLRRRHGLALHERGSGRRVVLQSSSEDAGTPIFSLNYL